MRACRYILLLIVTSIQACAASYAQPSDNSLQIYAVRIVMSPPLEKTFTGDGIYLGDGKIITAAHVIGSRPSLANPHVLIGGEDLPAKIIKHGSFEDTDLALLSIDATQLPMRLRLRRNPLCKDELKIGMQVIDVVVDALTVLRVVSPQLISPLLRAKFSTLIDSPQRSGSGLFDADKKCLLGIVSAKMPKFETSVSDGHPMIKTKGFAGYFVPSTKIADFLE